MKQVVVSKPRVDSKVVVSKAREVVVSKAGEVVVSKAREEPSK